VTIRSEIEQDADVMEFRSILENFSQLQRRKARGASIALGLFVTSLLCVLLLSDLGPLHRYWREVGKPAVLIWLASLVWATCAVGFWWSAWKGKREANHDLRNLLEDRYGE
jgi:hypothetical protein